MKKSIFYEKSYRKLENKIKDFLNNYDFVLNEAMADTRAVGGLIEKVLKDNFELILKDFCKRYDTSFSRRAMADFAFLDKNDFFIIVDSKTHREDTKFNMPNLTSVDRLSRFYEEDTNVFSILMVKYTIKNNKLKIKKIHFIPIEFLDWSCLTIGALGFGQIQIKNSNKIKINYNYSRKVWMLEFFEVLLNFYPKEIVKINSRIQLFEERKETWKNKKDIWK